jgi:putative peptidoglycan lipid II flippase
MKRRRVGAAAVVIAAVTALSRIGGFLREAAVAAVFGAGAEVDSFLVAQSVPNVLIALLSTAVVTSALPALTHRVACGDSDGATRTFNAVATTVLLGLVPVTFLLFLAAPLVVRLLAPGFGVEQTSVAAHLARIVLVSTVVVAATNLLSALLHAHRRHVWPSLEGLPFNAVMITAALVLGPVIGVEALAIGFVAGSIARLGVQLLGLRGTQVRLRPRLDLRDPGLRESFALLPTVAISHVASNINHVVDRLVASTLRTGTIAAIGFGHRLATLPHGLLSHALIQVLYPTLSARLATDGPGAAGDLLRRGTVTLSIVLVPVAALLAVESTTIVTLVYGRGRFDADDVALTAAALLAFAPGLAFTGVRDVALRGLYGLSDRRSPIIAAVTGAGVNIIGDVTLGPTFGVTGLALATSASQAVSCAVAFSALRRVDPQLRRRMSARPLAAVAIAGSVAVLVMVLVAAAAPVGATMPEALIRVAVVGGVGLAGHVLVLRLLGVDELADLTGLLRGVRTRFGR